MKKHDKINLSFNDALASAIENSLFGLKLLDILSSLWSNTTVSVMPKLTN